MLPPTSAFVGRITYAMSGGTGAVGLKMVHWMAERGARYFLLFSRRGELSLRQSELDSLRGLARHGVHVTIVKADVSVAEDVRSAFQLTGSKGYPTKMAVVGLAMALSDDLLPSQTPERFAPVLACKVDGVRTMLACVAKQDVTFVLLFSSVSSVVGNHGHASYAAANSFLDSYAFWLRAQGYAATTINLGSVDDVGTMADDPAVRRMVESRGVLSGLTAHGVCRISESVLLRSASVAQYLHGSMDWSLVCQAFPSMASRAQHLIDFSAPSRTGLGGSAAQSATLAEVSAVVAALLDVPADKMDNTKSLSRQGLDSLLAVELSSSLKKRFGIAVSQMQLLGGMNVEDVFRQLPSPQQATLSDTHSDTAKLHTHSTAAADAVQPSQPPSGSSSQSNKHGAASADEQVVRAVDVRLSDFISPTTRTGASQTNKDSASISSSIDNRSARCTLLTGCTGFLGKFILLELLSRIAPSGAVVCLVRAVDDADAVSRVRAVLAAVDAGGGGGQRKGVSQQTVSGSGSSFRLSRAHFRVSASRRHTPCVRWRLHRGLASDCPRHYTPS